MTCVPCCLHLKQCHSDLFLNLYSLLHKIYSKMLMQLHIPLPPAHTHTHTHTRARTRTRMIREHATFRCKHRQPCYTAFPVLCCARMHTSASRPFPLLLVSASCTCYFTEMYFLNYQSSTLISCTVK